MTRHAPIRGFFYGWRRERTWFEPLFEKIAGSNFAQATKFARSKFERAMRGPKGELQDVIRNVARRARRGDAPSNPDHESRALDSRLRGNDDVGIKQAPNRGIFVWRRQI